MVNAALERYILKLSIGVFFVAAVLIFAVFHLSFAGAGAALLGFAMSILLFEATAFLFHAPEETSPIRKVLAHMSLPAVFAVLLFVLYWMNRHSVPMFWCVFTGVMVVPATVMIYIVLEAFGITNTNYFT